MTTTVTQSSNAYDTRTSSEGGCDPNGCTPALTRDQSWADQSRWSCSEQLDNSQCKITYNFEEPQDIVRLNINFYRGDERVRTLKIEGSGGFEQTITSSGTTNGYERFDVNTDETSWLSMEGQNLQSTEWISITEVRTDSSLSLLLLQLAVARPAELCRRCPTTTPRKWFLPRSRSSTQP